MKHPYTIIATVATILLFGTVLGAYIIIFGGSLSEDHDVWAEFGSYIGGTLGAAFGALAFLVLVATLNLQQRELVNTSKTLNDQINLTRQGALSQEYLIAFKDIDSRLNETLSTVISADGSSPILTIAMMVAESDRIANSGENSGAYQNFLDLGRERGSIVEAHVRNLVTVTNDFSTLLAEFSHVAPNSSSPLVIYYSKKAYRVAHLLEDLGHSDAGVRQAFNNAVAIHAPKKKAGA